VKRAAVLRGGSIGWPQRAEQVPPGEGVQLIGLTVATADQLLVFRGLGRVKIACLAPSVALR
jgi:hypothetical protein